MVIYDLVCDARHEFEGWFNRPDDLVSQQEMALLRCPVCDSIEVSKKVTAPKLSKKSNSTEVSYSQQRQGQPVTNLNASSVEAYSKLQAMLIKVHKYIDSNFEDVGNKFADEALSMHRGEKELNSIRGTATADELKDLADEGVTALPLPAKPVDKKKLN
jgi:hypothetical protein